ncbi:MAG: hypothetical protein ACREMQ_12960, partial [Longimicrobiales bacterium]
MSSSRSDPTTPRPACSSRSAYGIASVALFATVVGCELQEVSIAEPEDVVVAEMVLFAGDLQQRLLLHRTFGDTAAVAGARIEVRSQTGVALPFALVPDSLCLFTDPNDPSTAGGSCYESAPLSSFVQPGGRYSLRIELADGGVMTGTTVVPDTFTVLRPARLGQSLCVLAPGSTFEMMWTRSARAWVYVVETELRGIVAALRDRGITLDYEPLRLIGLSISENDTTIVFPTELGIFERFDNRVAAALLELRDGLLAGVNAE